MSKDHRPYYHSNIMLTCTAKDQILIQGIYEPLGRYATAHILDYGTNIVAGVSTGQGGNHLDSTPVFDLVEQAVTQVGEIHTSLIFTPDCAVLDAALEAIAAGIQQLIIHPANVPPLDMMKLLQKTENQDILILGSGSSGLFIPDQVLLGLHHPTFAKPGNIAIISRTDHGLTDEVVWTLTQGGLGQSIIVSLGTGDIIGSNFNYWLNWLEQDDNTEIIILLEHNAIGNEAAATLIPKNYPKPIISYIAGQQISVTKMPQDSATLIASQSSTPFPHTSTASQKIAACKKAKVPLAKSLSQLNNLVKKEIKKISNE